MPAIHPHPHPLQGKYVDLVSEKLNEFYGKVRVEDWHDRIFQESVKDSLNHGVREAADYIRIIGLDNFFGSIQTPKDDEVVRAHDAYGNSLCLHNSWLPQS